MVEPSLTLQIESYHIFGLSPWYFEDFSYKIMSKWQKLTETELSVQEQGYFKAKAKDGMCMTENGHLCYVGK